MNMTFERKFVHTSSRADPSRAVNMTFEREFGLRKEAVLKALISEEKDKSRKGGVDAPIADLISQVNSHPHFFTTSSCSGRISIFLEQHSAPLSADPYHPVEGHHAVEKTKVKQGGSWIYVSHEAAEPAEVSQTVRRLYVCQETKLEGLLVFRFEPFILALECFSVAAAQQLLACAMASGYRESGISSVGRRIIVAVRSSLRLEVPIGEKGKLLVPEEYLQYLTASANKKFALNLQKIDKFKGRFMDQFRDQIAQPLTSSCESMKKALGLKSGQRRQKGMNFQAADKLWISLLKRQSKLLSRISSLEAGLAEQN